MSFELSSIHHTGPGSVIPRLGRNGRSSDTDTSRAYHGLPKRTFAGANVEYLPYWWRLKVWIENQGFDCDDERKNEVITSNV